MEWTSEQSRAIDIPVSDLIVSAAAGSGKTAVMAERIIRRLTQENCVDIDRILVVTYTKAAASEIKERVMKKILDELEKGHNPVLSNQLVKLPYANFCTIHSFCLNLVRKYFYLLDIDPAVQISDQTEADSIKQKAVSEVLDEYYEKGDKVFERLVSMYSSKHDGAVADIIMSVYDFSRTLPDGDKWLDEFLVSYDEYVYKSQNCLLNESHLIMDYVSFLYNTALNICRNNIDEAAKYYEFIDEEFNAVRAGIDLSSYSNAFESINAFAKSSPFGRWPVDKNADANLKARLKDLRTNAKDLIVKKLLKNHFYLSIEEIHESCKTVFPYISKIVELTHALDDKITMIKSEKNVIDFSDFEHLALKLLKNEDGTPSDIAVEVADSFDEIYIDEYQDCNNIQNTIFNFISSGIRGKGNMFCVGDMKQSIYRFRDSNPILFRDKCDNSVLYTGGDVASSNKILFSQNFRSRSSVLGFVNDIFEQIMSVECGELNYTECERLNYSGGYPLNTNSDLGIIDIDIIDKSNTFGSEYEMSNISDVTSVEAEAYHIASKIKHYTSGNYMLYDKKNNREYPASYRDIVILLRSTKKYAEVFEKVFSDMSIPVYCDKGTPLLDTKEIKLLINFLRIIDNPDDDIPLVSVMKSPIYGFDENELLEIRLADKESSFYLCIKKYISSYNNKLSEKLTEFLNTLNRYYDLSRYMKIDEFICCLIDETGFFTYLSLFKDSELKKTNVRYFLQKAKDFEKSNFKGIYSFVKYIESNKDDNSSGAKILSESDDVVRIMSIHKSKGLEFPIVILAGTGSKLNDMDSKKSVIAHRNFGLGVDCVYPHYKARVNTVNKLAIKQNMNYETMSEELRVLYVALTRASEKIVITATVDKGAEKLNRISDLYSASDMKVAPYVILNSERYIDIILHAIGSRHYIPDGDITEKKASPSEYIFNFTLKNICEICTNTSNNKYHDVSEGFKGRTGNYHKVKEIMDYKYPHSELSAIPTNLTVTELKKMSVAEEEIYCPFSDYNLARPTQFGFSNKKTGAGMGTLVHYVMEQLDFSTVSSIDDIGCQLKKLVSDGFVSEEDCQQIEIKKIYNFFCSDIGKRMIACNHSLRKEFSFKYMINAKDVYNTGANDKLVVQGTIDAMFEDADGKIVIVDYKTDKIIDGDTKSIVDRYHSQLDYYADAVKTILGKEVKEKILYLFDGDCELYV